MPVRYSIPRDAERDATLSAEEEAQWREDVSKGTAPHWGAVGILRALDSEREKVRVLREALELITEDTAATWIADIAREALATTEPKP